MWLIIAALILAGIVLIIVEIVFIPGTTVVGLLGAAFVIAGVVFAYREFGNDVGFYVLLGTGVTTAVALYLSFRKGAWNKVSNKSVIDSKVNEGIAAHLNEGEEGITVSALRPIGTADFHGKNFEVKTSGEYVPNGVKVKIVKIRLNDIVVEPIQ
ncbi:MAG TPA: NfeD family protein [Cyclobacteriaceae bacterium]|nr:NfeD family protein [Cyclobacteriaceae bacterium]